MDGALASRSLYTTAPALPRAEVTPVPAAIPSLLPQPSQSVAALAERSAGRFDGNDTRARARAELPADRLSDETIREIEREIEFDEETKDLVVKNFDPSTGQIVSQFPAESLLKLRAYVRAQSDENVEPFLARTA